MASYQCQGWDSSGSLSRSHCFPPNTAVLRKLRLVLRLSRHKKLLVATDDVEVNENGRENESGITHKRENLTSEPQNISVGAKINEALHRLIYSIRGG